jgi:hypothetical protein
MTNCPIHSLGQNQNDDSDDENDNDIEKVTISTDQLLKKNVKDFSNYVPLNDQTSEWEEELLRRSGVRNGHPILSDPPKKPVDVYYNDVQYSVNKKDRFMNLFEAQQEQYKNIPSLVSVGHKVPQRKHVTIQEIFDLVTKTSKKLQIQVDELQRQQEVQQREYDMTRDQAIHLEQKVDDGVRILNDLQV